MFTPRATEEYLALAFDGIIRGNIAMYLGFPSLSLSLSYIFSLRLLRSICIVRSLTIRCWRASAFATYPPARLAWISLCYAIVYLPARLACRQGHEVWIMFFVARKTEASSTADDATHIIAGQVLVNHCFSPFSSLFSRRMSTSSPLLINFFYL